MSDAHQPYLNNQTNNDNDNNDNACQNNAGRLRSCFPRLADNRKVYNEVYVRLLKFENENNEFIIKELVVVSTNGEINELHLFRLPYGFHQLPDGLKMQVRWLEKCFRGLY